MSKVLYRKKELAVPAWFDPQFPFKDSSYRVKIELGLIPVWASIPCGKCARTTREMLKNLGMTISADDQKVDVLDLVSKLPDGRSHSTPDPEHVSVITYVFASEIDDICSMTPVPPGSPLFKEIEAHLEKILFGLVTCNACSSSEDYFAGLLKA